MFRNNSLFLAASHEPYQILIILGLILILAKSFSLLLSKIHVPQVIGYLIAGLVIGLLTFIPNDPFQLTVMNGQKSYVGTGLDFFAKIGVVLIRFSAGLETDLKKVKSMGLQSIIITLLGVAVPLLFGFLAAFVTNKCTASATHPEGILTPEGQPEIYSELYYGVILSATSVSITVATLKELKKLDTPVGTALVSAAILDDVIGIVLLSLILSLASSGKGGRDNSTFAGRIINGAHITNTAASVSLIIVFRLLFFAITIGIGFVAKRFFNWLGNKYPHHIRITILALGFCFVWSYLAEYFSIADITGAYRIGLVLSNTVAQHYIDHRTETIADNIFAPVFFANIAMARYQGEEFTTQFLAFGIIWVICGLLGKIVGAGCGSLICKFKFKDSLKVGIGRMARAEVLIVCADKGIAGGLIDNQIMVYTLVLILVSSFLTPIILKALYKGEPAEQTELPKEATK